MRRTIGDENKNRSAICTRKGTYYPDNQNSSHPTIEWKEEMMQKKKGRLKKEIAKYYLLLKDYKEKLYKNLRVYL